MRPIKVDVCLKNLIASGAAIAVLQACATPQSSQTQDQEFVEDQGNSTQSNQNSQGSNQNARTQNFGNSQNMGQNQGASNENLGEIDSKMSDSINNFVEDTPAVASNPVVGNLAPVNAASSLNVANMPSESPINVAALPNSAATLSAPPPSTPSPSASGQRLENRIVDLGPPHGVVSWVGYNFKKDERKLEIQIVTQGKPVYKIFQEVNRAKQPEIVVRFLNTEIRHKIRRDIDATEFRSPVAFIRLRRDHVFRHTDVILTMRDAVQPQFLAKGSHIMLTFDIPERWYSPQGNGQEPIAKVDIQPDANVMPVIDTGSDPVPEHAKSSVAVYVDDPGRDTFGSSPTTGVPLAPVGGSNELLPVSDALPLGTAPMNSAVNVPTTVPLNAAPTNGVLTTPPSNLAPFNGAPQNGTPANSIPANETPTDIEAPINGDSTPESDDQIEVRFEESLFQVAAVAQAGIDNFAADIPPPVVNAEPMNGTSSNFLSNPGPASFSSSNIAPIDTPVASSAPVSDIVGVDQNSAAPQTGATKKVMKFDFRNATIGSVMRAIASESGLNFVMPTEVSNQKVTVSLTNVSWDVALKAVLESNRLGMEEIGPKIVRIDALKTFVDDRDAQEKARQATESLIPTKVLVMRLSYADADEVAKTVAQMLPKPNDPSNVAQKRNYDRFKVQVDKRSNSVIIEAIPTEIAKLKTLIDRLDTRTPQVRIASRIVEVIDKIEQAFGINWNTPFNNDAGRGTGFGNLPFPNSASSVFAVDPSFSGTPVGGASIKLGSINNAIALDIQLKAMEGKSESETLQNQDMLVEDNAEANIIAGQTDYFIIPASADAPAQLSAVDYNTSLKVKPHITADGAVQMKLEITGDSPLKSSTANAAAGKTSRKLTTTLLRKSGDTAVIGGLYGTEKSKSVSGVPFLSKIPIFGALFRSSSSVDQKRDLLIMITPTIQSAVSSGSDVGSTEPLDDSTSYAPAPSNVTTPGNVALNSAGGALEVPNQLGNAGQNSSQNGTQKQQQGQKQSSQQNGLSQQQQQGNVQQGNTVEVDDEVDAAFE